MVEGQNDRKRRRSERRGVAERWKWQKERVRKRGGGGVSEEKKRRRREGGELGRVQGEREVSASHPILKCCTGGARGGRGVCVCDAPRPLNKECAKTGRLI